MIGKVRTWFDAEERHALDVRDMLRRAVGVYHKCKYQLEQDRPELVRSCCQQLTLDAKELDLLLRSALAVGVKYHAGLSEHARTDIYLNKTGQLRGDTFSEEIRKDVPNLPKEDTNE